MLCEWKALLEVLPIWMRDFVDKHGAHTLQELRLRVNSPPTLIMNNRSVRMNRSVTTDDLVTCLNMVTAYSPWSASTASKCYYTASGGHRIGLCGNVIVSNGQVTGIRELTSLCIRIARDFPGIAKDLGAMKGSVLIAGKPGSGKTTLLRDYIRQASHTRCENVTVVDERQEVFPYYNGAFCFDPGLNTDVLSGCDKTIGIETALRNMGPSMIALDEITAESDCKALLKAGWCGVDLIVTAHAGSRQDLLSRPVYRPLIEARLFDHLVIMHPDKSWHLEELVQ